MKTLLILVLLSSLGCQAREPGHVLGQSPYFQSQIVTAPRRTLTRVDLIWSQIIKTCYFEVHGLSSSDESRVAFVDVPDDWCEGMR